MNPLERPIVNWFKKNKRDLPWRNTSPWGIMVSEYMLQQTPVSRVLPKWIEWMDRWSTPADLAAAISAFAFQKRTLVMDINIRRLLTRVYVIGGFLDIQNRANSKITELAWHR